MDDIWEKYRPAPAATPTSSAVTEAPEDVWSRYRVEPVKAAEPVATGRPGVGTIFGRGIDQLQGMGYGALEAVGEAVGSEGLTDFGRKGREFNDQQMAEGPQNQDFWEIDSVGDAFAFAKESVVQNLPQMGVSIGGSLAGAAAGSVAGPAGTAIGAALGALIPNFGLALGEVQGAVKEKDPDAAPSGWTWAGASAMAALDSVLPVRLGTVLRRTFGKEVAETAAKTFLTAGIRKEILRDIGVEGLTEAMQSVITEAAAAKATGQEIDEDWWKNAIAEGVAGAIVGGTLGGASAGLERLRGPRGADDAPPPPEAPPTDLPPIIPDAEYDSPRLSDADRASPIPNQILDEGYAKMDGSAPQAPQQSSVPAEERAILRNMGEVDEDIDLMGPEERSTNIERARISNISATEVDVQRARTYTQQENPTSSRQPAMEQRDGRPAMGDPTRNGETRSTGLPEARGDWTTFDRKMRSLNVPRAEMPQVKAGDRSALVQFLKARDVGYTTATVDPYMLQPTQAEFSPSKVAQAKEYKGTDRAILVSSDYRIVDGHHQWLAAREKGEPVSVIRLNAPVAEVLPLVKEFPSSTTAPAMELVGDKSSPDFSANNRQTAPSTVEGAVKAYPVAKRGEWYGDADFDKRGGKIERMTPDQFLARARPLEIDEVSRENIDDLKRHMLDGKTLDPLKFYDGGKEDGRHRAVAAKELGIKTVPVITFGDQIDKAPATAKEAPVEAAQEQKAASPDPAQPGVTEAAPEEAGDPDFTIPIFQIKVPRKDQPEGKAVPSSLRDASSLETSFAAVKRQAFKTNRDLKVAIQSRVQAALREARVKFDVLTKALERHLVTVAVNDARYALESNSNAIGWYNEKTRKALRIVSLMHPEVSTDPAARFAFTWALAVTSNGMKVNKNFSLAEKAYSAYVKTGRMPENVGVGTASAAINNGMKLFNVLVEQHGIMGVERFMTSMHSVKDIEAYTGTPVSGENKTTELFGAAALGPKIGNGFFANLYGYFDQLTIDRWLMRTWGRWTGELIVERPQLVAEKREQLQQTLMGMTQAERRAFSDIISMPLPKADLTLKGMDGVAKAITRASQTKDVRDEMASAAPAGDDLRKIGNALTKYLDGQKEQPEGPPERNLIRRIMGQALKRLQSDYPALTMADLQAVLWYPEKRLYEAAKSKEADSNDSYVDDEAPDYANAAAALARSQGIPQSAIERAQKEVDDEILAEQRSGRAGRGAGDRASQQEDVRPNFSLGQRIDGEPGSDAGLLGVRSESRGRGAQARQAEGRPADGLSQQPVTGADLARLDDRASLSTFLRRPGWGVVTASVSPPDFITSKEDGPLKRSLMERHERGNADRNKRLQSILKRRNIPYVTMQGVYKGKPDGTSYLIIADEATTLALGREFDQESILTRDGLVFARREQPDVRVTGDVMVGDRAASEEFYSVTPGGTPFSMGLDFGASGPGVPVIPEGYTTDPTRPQLPINADGMVELHHWSSKPLTEVDPAFRGTGPLRGPEVRRGARVSFFGINPRRSMRAPGTGYVKEAGLGSIEHVALVDPSRLYPFMEDPDGLVKGRDISAAEDAIRAAGYIGYYSTDNGSGDAPLGNVAALFEAVPVRRKANNEPSFQRQQAGDRAGGRQGGSRAPLAGAPQVQGASGPDERLNAVAEDYARSIGIDLRRQAEYVSVDPERAARIAQAYEEMEHAPNDPVVREAFENLIQQTRAQYDALVAAGYEFFFIDERNDLYGGNPWNAMRDLRANQRMGVFPTEAGFGSGVTGALLSDNPMEADTGLMWGVGSTDGPQKRVLANDLFRAVHDAFGHGLEGSGFRADGEENAWQSHVRLFTGSAVGAITTETRGQNSWLNYGPYGEQNRTAKVEDTVFADQKTGLMPSWTWTEGRAGDMDAPRDQRTARVVEEFGPVTVTLELTEEFLAEANAVGTAMRADLDRMGLTDISLRVSERMSAVVRGENWTVDGRYFKKMIDVALNAADRVVTLNHEVIHALKELGVFSNTEWAILERKATKEWMERYDVLDRYPGSTPAMQREEGIAQAYGEWAAGAKVDGIIAKSFRKIRDVIEALGNGLRGRGFRSVNGIFRDIQSGRIGNRERGFNQTAGRSVAQRLREAFQIAGTERRPVFYSPLVRALQGVKQTKATPEDWKAILPKLPGVKAIEMEWLGVNEWLDAQTGQVTREDLQAYVNENQLEVTTEQLAGEGGQYDTSDIRSYVDEPIYPDDWADYADIYMDDARGELEEAELVTGEAVTEEAVQARAEELAQEAYEPYEYGARIRTRDGEHLLTGYYNSDDRTYFFRELSDNEILVDDLDELMVEYVNGLNPVESVDGMIPVVGRGKFGSYTESGGDNYREILLRMPNLDQQGKNRAKSTDTGPFAQQPLGEARAFVNSSHFSQENIVVHARVKDRVDADGSKVMFIEEIQSDLGSAWRKIEQSEKSEGRRKELREKIDALDERGMLLIEQVKDIIGQAVEDDNGYRISMSPSGNTAVESVLNNWVERQAPAGRVKTELYEELVTDERAIALAREYRTVSAELVRLQDELYAMPRAVRADPTLPQTPFLNENYYALMVKRLLREAVDNGYAKLMWTPGYMQARRWDKAAQEVVEDIRWGNEGGTKRVVLEMSEGKVNTVTLDADGTMQKWNGEENSQITGKPLSALLGDAAKDILSKPEGEITGDKITFSNSGYAVAYDTQIRKAVEKLTKRYGAKVEVNKSLPDFIANPDEDTGVERAFEEFVATKFEPELMETIFRVFKEKGYSEDLARRNVESMIEQYMTRDAMMSRTDALRKAVIVSRRSLMPGFTDFVPPAPKAEAVWSVNITPEMVKDIQQGLPMFQRSQTQTEGDQPAFSLGQRIATAQAAAGTLVNKALVDAKKRNKIDRRTAEDGEGLSPYIHRKIVDYLDPLSRLVQSLGGKLADLMDPYLQARLYSDTVGDKIRLMYDRHLQPAIDELVKHGIELRELHEYLYALHAEERNRVVGLRNPVGDQLYLAVTDPSIVGASGWSTNQARAIIARVNADPRKAGPLIRAAQNIRQMLDTNLADQLAAGLINRQTYDLLTQQWKNYVPLKSEDGMSPNGDFMPSAGKGFDVRGKEFKGATGRFTEADNVILNAAKQSVRAQERIGKNEVGKAMLRLLNQHDPQGTNIAEVYWSDDPSTLGNIVKAKTVKRRTLDKSGKVVWTSQPNPFVTADDVLATKVGGRVYYIKFKDPKIGNALKNLQAEPLGFVMSMLSRVSNWQSIINTRMNPAFTPINIIRDLWTGYASLGAFGFTDKERRQVVGNVGSAMMAMGRNVFGKTGTTPEQRRWDAIVKDFMADGGKISFDNYASLTKDVETLEASITRAARIASGGMTPAQRGREMFTRFINLIEKLNDAGENGLRIAVYEASIRKGWTRQRAAFLARDITVDFKKKGELGSQMNAAYVFFNSSLQGNYNLAVRMGKSRAVKIVSAKFILAGIAISVINSMMAGDDEDGEDYYTKMLVNEPWKLERNLVLFIGGDKHLMVPLPFGFNAFNNIGVQLHAMGTGKRSVVDGISSIARVAFDSFNPMGSGSIASMLTPTIADPFLDMAVNENFAGNPIRPTENQFDPAPPPAAEQSFKSTNPAFIWLAKAMNEMTGGDSVQSGWGDVYPDNMEHLWAFVTGGVGRFISQIGETAIRATDGEFDPTKTPYVRSFFGESSPDRMRGQYFRIREEVQEAKAQLKDYIAQGDRERVLEYKQERAVDLRVVPAVDAAEKARRQLNKQRKAIEKQNPPDLKERLEKLDEREAQIMLQARKAYIKALKGE
jgi:hypothetical protein